jgi:NADH:ubiquinone oxidoreductase subunit C
MVLEDLGAKEERGELWIESNLKKLENVIKTLKFLEARLMTISGLDDQKEIKVFYHFDLNGKVVNVVVPLTGKNPTIKSVYEIYPNSDLYERELAEMFNIKVTGHPDLRPLFLSKDLEGKAPLRKSFKGVED